MEPSLSHPKLRSPLIWRILFHPMLYISLLVHGLVFAIPGQPEPQVDPEELEEEQEIDITSLSPIVKPLPEPQETPPPQSTPPQQTAPAVQQTVIPPQPQVIQTPAPEPAVAPADPTVAATPTPTPFDPTQYRGQIASGFESSDRYFAPGENPLPNFYRNPDAYFEDPSARPPVLRPGIIGNRAIMLNNVDLSQTQDEGLVSAFRPEDYLPEDVTLTRLDDYGGGPLYEVKTSGGDVVGYLNATPAKAGASTIIVLWENNPNAPAAGTASAAN